MWQEICSPAFFNFEQKESHLVSKVRRFQSGMHGEQQAKLTASVICELRGFSF
jgi:hypothetical protein